MPTLESKEAGLTVVLLRALSMPEGRFNTHTRQLLPAGNGLGMGVGQQIEAEEDAPFPDGIRSGEALAPSVRSTDGHGKGACGTEPWIATCLLGVATAGFEVWALYHVFLSLQLFSMLSLRQHSVLGARRHHGQRVGSRKKCRKLHVQPGWPWEGPRICSLGSHGLGGLSSRHWFSHGSGGQEPEV